MPNIRIVNWNIEKLGPTKAAVATMMGQLGRAIAQMQADVAIILEVSAGRSDAMMTTLSATANAASIALGGAANDYVAWLLSYPTGGECYGVLFRNLNTVRPIHVTAGPQGDANGPLTNLDRNQFETWPGTFLAMRNAYAAPLPAARPELPLIDVFASTAPVGRKRGRFAGRSLANGGYALGRGFRMPGLIMLSVTDGRGPAAAFHLIPVIVCHLGAVRSGANTLARGQIQQFKDTHLAQKFQKFQDAGYICLDRAPVAIQELMITGDFNVDFLQNIGGGGATARQRDNRAALNDLTPTAQQDGSGGPGALPRNPGPLPVVPFAGPFVDGPVNTAIPALALRAGVTANGTMLRDPAADPGPPPYTGAWYTGACFDNFFYGGTQLSATVQQLAGGDACEVYDVPGQVTQLAGLPGLNIGAIWTHYSVLPGRLVGAVMLFPLKTQWAGLAPNLNPGLMVPPALAAIDRLVGARYLSDHLPTVLQANLP